MKAPKLLNGDLVIENGNLVMIEGDEELVQSVQAILGTRKGEFFLNTDHGVSHDNLLGKPADEELARSDIIEALMQDERVESVDVVFEDDKSKRTRNVKVSIQKENGVSLTVDGGEFSSA